MISQIQTISLTLANRNFSKLIRDVENGATFVITRHGCPVATLTRHKLNKSADEDWTAAYERMTEILNKGTSLGGLQAKREELYDR